MVRRIILPGLSSPGWAMLACPITSGAWKHVIGQGADGEPVIQFRLGSHVAEAHAQLHDLEHAVADLAVRRLDLEPHLDSQPVGVPQFRRQRAGQDHLLDPRRRAAPPQPGACRPS